MWAFQESKLHAKKSDEAHYALGVIMGISVAQRKSPPFSKSQLERQPQKTQFGYIDSIALMNKVAAFGDAPEGEFRDLLGAPHSEPLR